MTDNGIWKYSGGQRIDDDCVRGAIDNLEDWHTSANYNRAKTLYGGYKTETNERGEEKYCYSYIAGDLTRAYDEETVSEVKRHMVCFDTGDKVNPLVFVLFDKITSKDASFKKSILLHTQNTPLITEAGGRRCAVITNLMSRLYVQTLLNDVNYEFVGGRDMEYMVRGENVSCFFPERFEGLNSVYNTEGGLGRLEISPKTPSLSDSFLTVMYVGPHTDCSPYLNLDSNILQPYREAKEIRGEGIVGAAILGSAVIFSSDAEYIKEGFTAKLPAGVKRCLVFGLKGGVWLANGVRYEVNADSAMAEIPVNGADKLVMEYLGES